MIDIIMESFANPVKSKLLLSLHTHGESTAKELAAVCPDVPQATLYRYLNRMEADGVIEVARENRVRGVMQRVYRIKADLEHIGRELLSDNNAAGLAAMFLQFAAGLASEFKEYATRPEADLSHDVFAFSVAPVYASDEELKHFSEEVGKLITPMLKNKAAPERKMHSISLIITPPKGGTSK